MDDFVVTTSGPSCLGCSVAVVLVAVAAVAASFALYLMQCLFAGCPL